MVYAGVGLTALPLDLILEFMNRPIRMKREDFLKQRDALCAELVALKNEGEEIEKESAVAKNTEGCISFSFINPRVGRSQCPQRCC